MQCRLVLSALSSALLLLLSSAHSRGDTPSTQPAPSTGAIDLTLTQRNPLSSPAELARRLNLSPSDVAPDYDLSKCPFKAYVPKNYTPSTPVGLFVYLGYKDTVATPPLWAPILENRHLIFISPVCHSGNEYAPAVPLWQSMGLALDAVYNLQRKYSIDPRRIYMMSWATDSTRLSLACADVFTGFIVSGDPEYCLRMYLPNGSYYSPEFASPPGEIFARARDRAFFFITDGPPDPETILKIATMKQTDFDHVKSASLSFVDDLHYPNFKAEWFEQQALPFLDVSSSEEPAAANSPATTGTSATSKPAPVNEAKHLLYLAQIYIANGQNGLAEKRLREILQYYPNSPEADEAKKLIAQINGQ